MKHTSYLKRASKRFLAGTSYRSPVEAVEAGVRSLGEWAQMLEECRSAEPAARPSRSQARARLEEEAR